MPRCHQQEHGYTYMHLNLKFVEVKKMKRQFFHNFITIVLLGAVGTLVSFVVITLGTCGLSERHIHICEQIRGFALWLGHIVPVGLGKYLQVLTEAIHNPEVRQASGDASVEQLLEKMFSVFMDHANLWADISNLPEINSPELSESNIYCYIHQYIHLLERDVRLDVLQGKNEKIRKCFKTSKLSSSKFAKICKHASLAWCRCILIKLASITPLLDSVHATYQLAPLSNGLQLFIDLQPDELLISSADLDHALAFSSSPVSDSD